MYKVCFWLYNLLFPLLFLLYSPFYLRKLVKRGGFRDGFGERFGRFSTEKRQRLAALNRPVWIHAVSVGETIAAISFIKTWREEEPNLPIILSTTTSTGQKIARDKAPDGVEVIYCPIDWYLWVSTSLKAVKPSLLVIFEVEVWPTLITTASSRGIPLALVNGRMSDNSAAGYAKHRTIFRPIFNSFDFIGVQSDEDAKRIQRIIGESPTIHVCNTMKFDQIPDTTGRDVHAVLESAFGCGAGDYTYLVAASTHPGEETLFADAFVALKPDFPNLRLINIPRHVERIADVMEAYNARNLPFQRLTELRAKADPSDPSDVLVVDTTGEMMDFLAIADIVFVGKCLADNDGGHNIIEPAIFGKPILYGDRMSNFRLVADMFARDNATVVLSGDTDLEPTLRRLLSDPEECQRLASASRQVVDAQRGAISRTISHLRPLIAG